MAEIQDLETEVSEIETVAELNKEKAQSAVSSEDKSEITEDLPERYRGKSVKEIIELAEMDKKNVGRYANEAGELRRLADELIKSQLKPKVEQEQPKEVDFFENPQEAIRRAVETNPRVMAAEQYAINAQKFQAQQQLMQKHPDFKQIVEGEDFANWVKASKIRMELFQKADKHDFDAADELLGTFKELKAAKQQQTQSVASAEDKASRAKTMQAASVDTGGSGESSRKVYRRADLIRLQINDPARYESMNDEILQAYAEGRVK